MKTYTYNFELDDALHLFIQAFDSIVINRYNKYRTPIKNSIQVRYIYAPKERVLFDLINKQQNVTLPVVAISLTGLQRDTKRVFNKIYGFPLPQYSSTGAVSAQDTKLLRSPEPVDIGIKMSILARYQEDINQIYSNFVPYNNPYIIISWQIPSEANLLNVTEVRMPVLWDGNITFEYPKEIDGQTDFLISAETNFTIKAWLFPYLGNNDIANIFYAYTNVTSVSSASDLTSGNYYSLQQQVITPTSVLSAFSNTDVVSVSGIPQFTGQFYAILGGLSAL